MKKYFSTIYILLFSTSVLAFTPRIEILPDTIVEVGDEVYFCASGTTGLIDSFKAVYEWDFGNGKSMKRGYPQSYSANTGPNCIQYFMEPGTFTVRLIITDTDGSIDTAKKVIQVLGETLIEGFELWRASYHGRIAQYVYAQVPESIRSDSGNRFRVRIIKDRKDTTKIVERSPIKAEERFLLENGKLSAGNYELLVELLTLQGKRISYIKEKFSKNYDGIPKVGINEHNAICINGAPFFPVTPFIKNKTDLPIWANKYINSAYGVGYYETQNITNWTDYLNVASTCGIKVIGPLRWEGKAPKGYSRNADIEKLGECVETTKDHNGLMMWMWDDEPNMGGRELLIPAPVMAAWTKKSHLLDQQHPVTTNLYGYSYLPYYDDNGTSYDYLNNADIFGGKKHNLFDVIGFDIYPLQRADHASLTDRRVISEYVEALKLLQDRNYHLVPAMSFIEVQDTKESETPHPKPEQIVMEAWLNVVHGIKGISWFHFFGETPAENLAAMELFCSQITKYAKVVLGPASRKSVVNNASVPNKRVDFIVRDVANGSDTTTYIFAVRLTEPDSGQYYIAAGEPEKIEVKFEVQGASGTVFSELDKRQILVQNGTFVDTFGKCDVRIYRLGKPANLDSKQIILRKNNKSASIIFPNFKTSIEIMLTNDSRNKNYIQICSLNGRLIEKIPLTGNNRIVSQIRAGGIYIAKHDASPQVNRIVLSR